MEGRSTRKDPERMGTSKYPAELRERATRGAVEARKDPEARQGALADREATGCASRSATELG